MLKPILIITATIILFSCSKPGTSFTPDPGPGTLKDTTSNLLVYAASDNGKLYAFDAADGTVKWTFTINSSGVRTNLSSTPAFADSTLYIGSSDKNIYAVDAYSGTEKWRYPTQGTNGFFYSSPVVTGNVVYIGGYEPRFYAIDAKTGRLVWSKSLPRDFTTAAIFSDNTVYTGCNDGTLYALNASNGSVNWIYKSDRLSFSISSPCVKEGAIYALAAGINTQPNPTTNSALLVLNAANGQQLGGRPGYTFSFGFPNISSPTVDDSLVYIGGTDSCLYAINTYALDINNRVWVYKTGGPVSASPCFNDSLVFVGSNNGVLYALNKLKGTLRWSFSIQPFGGNSSITAPVQANSVIFFGSDNGFFALDAKTGKKKWQSATGAAFVSGPCLVTKQGVAVHSSISGMSN